MMESLRSEFKSSGQAAGAPQEIHYQATLDSMEKSLAACKQRLPEWDKQRLARQAAPQTVKDVRGAVQKGGATRANPAPASVYNIQPPRRAPRAAHLSMEWTMPIGQEFPIPLDAYTMDSFRADYSDWDLPLAKAFYAYFHLNRK
ncbi:hypothetical protein ACTVZO_37535 [Streptomyces sp. IBSNAI002]|uniref:hypothetical protein n=1 Tax=Streptomyces sp. IBSNAI002 TaxID=3457500 RepID=UPI003FD118D6